LKEEITVANYFHIYLWKSLSLITSFLSLVVVIPFISSDPELFGIYSFCISLSLYLSYADIGFLSAGQKYAAEEFAKGNITEEIKIYGFTFWLLILMFIPFSLTLIFLSSEPDLIIKDLSFEGSVRPNRLEPGAVVRLTVRCN